jgi:hypothetical protein
LAQVGVWYAWGLVVGEFVISRSVDLHRASASPYLRLVTLAVSTNLGFGVVVDYWPCGKGFILSGSRPCHRPLSRMTHGRRGAAGVRWATDMRALTCDSVIGEYSRKGYSKRLKKRTVNMPPASSAPSQSGLAGRFRFGRRF